MIPVPCGQFSTGDRNLVSPVTCREWPSPTSGGAGRLATMQAARPSQPPKVTGAFAALLGLYAAAAEMSWLVRGVLVVIGLGMVGYICWHINRHLILRILLGFALAFGLVASTWESIWTDFSKKHASFIERAAFGDQITAAATRATDVFDQFNHYWGWSLLAAVVLTILGWRSRLIWRVRRRISWLWGRALSEQVWISRDQAIRTIKDSPWGRIKEPNVVRTISIFEPISANFSRQQVVHGMSDTAKELLKFDIFIQKTLDKFCEVNPSACRRGDAQKQEVDETALRVFLRKAIDDGPITFRTLIRLPWGA